MLLCRRLQGSSKRVFCNFDGCYSKRGDDGAARSDTADGLRREQTDPLELLLLRLHEQRSALPDDVLTPQTSANVETADAPDATIDERRSNEWINRRPPCCPGASRAKILR